ncbi:MAG: hypothetical protein JW889_13595 [Verrucomicrobia bacterium]|nr:hypothetical protein [Verrucomicrobiota bacterium]
MPRGVLRSFAIAVCCAVAGCSQVLNFDAIQCSTDADCVRIGADQCVEGSCIFTQSQGGAPEVVKSTVASSTAGSPPSSDNGSAQEASEGAAGAPGAGGSAGEATGCTSTRQCVADHLDEPYICPEPGAECLALKTSECPLTFGDYDDDNALVVGALLHVPASAPLSQMSTLNVKLAVKEFNESVGGLPGGPLGKLRPLVMVVCRNDVDLVSDGAKHLVDKLKVPAILAHLPSAELKELFVDYALPKGTFVINPGYADNTLTSLASDGLFWHVIGDVRDVAPTYVPLLNRIESYVKQGSEQDIKVAMLVADRYAEKSIADTMVPDLEFNGKSVLENGSNFYSATVPALADEPSADYAAVNAALIDFEPTVIMAITREEFVYKILPVVEENWPYSTDAPPRPFYVVPTTLAANLDLLDFVATNSHGATTGDKQRRIVGVAPASAEDLALYNQFLVRFSTEYPEFDNPGGFENFYDAVYLLADAMYAAGKVPKITGADIARGMQRVVTGSTNIEIGPTRIADGFSALATGGAIRLIGTMGPADFDPGLGARRGTGSVYCFLRQDSDLTFAYDVLRYERSSGELVGELPCFDGF